MRLFQVIGILALLCCCSAAPMTEPEEAPMARTDDESPKADSDEALPDAPARTLFAIAIPELRQTQYAAFDGKGVYSFGYAYPEQMHTESRFRDGLVSGSYFYRGPEGMLNKVEYRADDAGFRVAANNLPVFKAEQPEPVRDTAEVEEAKRKHFEAYQAIASHISKSQDTDMAQVSAADGDSSSAQMKTNKVYVAPLDIEPIPAGFVGPSSKPAEIKDSESALPVKPDDSDFIVDEVNQAVITNPEQDDTDSETFEIDAEPVKLLAQFYSRHLKDNGDELKPIPRPAGFHPQNLEIPRGFDIFRRSEGRDRDSIVVTNPEFVDLRAFLQTTQFRSGMPNSKIIIKAKEKPSPVAQDDLSHSDDMDPTYHAAVIPQELFNYYYNLPYGQPAWFTRETIAKLPESLKNAAQGLGAVDGQHSAQVAPSQKNKVMDLFRQQGMMQRFVSPYSPFSSYYSPYYFFRQPFGYYPSSNPYYFNPYYY